MESIRGLKGLVKENMESVNSLNKIFPLIFSMEKIEQMLMPESYLLGRFYEELSQIEVTRNEVLKLVDKLYLKAT